ncbi:MAG: acetoacetate decarboxylase family protein [Moraxellaceae bacterium]|nr:acetoacetate decarboxylase family protein [Moraxellaceae bacterium]
MNMMIKPKLPVAHNDPFFLVPRRTVRTSVGKVELPIMYYDTSSLVTFFMVDRERVDALLTGTGMVPALTVGGRALAALACYEYRDTSVGVYNEVGLTVAVTRQGEAQELGGWKDVLTTLQQPEMRHVAFHILDLPVTTEMANSAGRKIWGFPKFVTEIPFRLQGRDFACQVMEPGTSQSVMTLSGRMGPSIPNGPLSLALLSHHNGRLCRSTVNVRGGTRLALPGSVRLTVDGGSHVMRDRLMALGMDDIAPLALMWTHAFQSRLNEGVDLD